MEPPTKATLPSAPSPAVPPIPSTLPPARKSELTETAEVYWVRDADQEFKTLKKEDITAMELLHRRTYPIHDVDSITNDQLDLVQLEDINEASILHNLKLRFKQDEIYTSLGTIIVAVNPYKWIEQLYTTDMLNQYKGASANGITDLKPHVYATAERAYYGLMEHHKDQSIIISGESGAGKTEATKKCLAYLATVAESTSGVEKRILAANPVLEAFGNAKTLRNDNSSRFGKWMENYFDASGKIIGCSNQNFLLEKSRVVVHDKGERNYHAFYHLILGAEPEDLKALHLSEGPKAFHYINQSGIYTLGPERPSEKEMYQELITAMKALHFEEEEMMGISVVLASILHLGNIEFVPLNEDDENGEDASKLSDDEVTMNSIAALVALLGWSQHSIEQSMCSRLVMSGRGSSYAVPVNVINAIEGRDSLAKLMYSSLFDWLVQRVNKAVSPSAQPIQKNPDQNKSTSRSSAFLTSSHGNASIDERGRRKRPKRGSTLSTSVTIVGHPEGASLLGVLDIFGFEIFESNSFEQLCINFCNEKLQQQL